MESGVLGAMMMDAQAVESVTEILEAKHFYKPSHQKIYRAILSLKERGKPVDLATVRDVLENNGQIDKCGGPGALIDIADSVLTSAHASAHANIIREKWLRRTLIAFANDVSKSCHNGHVDETHEIIRLATEQLDTIRANEHVSRRMEAIVCMMDTVEPQEITWLWEPYLPEGKITMLQGKGGYGKSTLSLQLAAIISRGFAFPDQTGMVGKVQREPANVLLMSAEDGIADTVRVRLDQAGADCSRIGLIQGLKVRIGDKVVEKAVSLVDILAIEERITQHKAKLLIVDPVQQYVGSDVDVDQVNEVRGILGPIGEMAERQKCAVLIIAHPRKSGGDPSVRILGSVDFWNYSRSVLMVERDPDDNSPGRYVLSHAKHNNSPAGISLAYELTEQGFFWRGTSNRTAEELAQISDAGKRATDRASAEDWLRGKLANGAVSSNDIKAKARREGITAGALKTAKTTLGVVHYPKSGIFVWELPSEEPQEAAEEPSEPTEFPPIDTIEGELR